MYPFERFTQRAKRVLTLAQEEAEQSDHPYIGTEHLLLGLVREREGMAARVLGDLGVDLAGVRRTLHTALARNEEIVVQHIVPTARVRTVLGFAVTEAERTGHFVGTEHLLLGLLLEGDGIAARVLEELGAGLMVTRSALRARHERSPSDARDEPAHEYDLHLALMAETRDRDTCTVLEAIAADPESRAWRALVECGVDANGLRRAIEMVRAEDDD